MFDEWIVALNSVGLEIDGARGDDTTLDADVVFACGLRRYSLGKHNPCTARSSLRAPMYRTLASPTQQGYASP